MMPKKVVPEFMTAIIEFPGVTGLGNVTDKVAPVAADPLAFCTI